MSARFCDACGSPVDTPRTVVERKQVSVLFADVVGSMRLAAALDPERLREIMHDLFNRSAQVVQRYQGTVDKFTGDGLMALFGAPIALEDHARRACITALGIQSAAKDLAADVMRKDGVDLRIRIGVNSGEVVAGEVGEGPGRYTAVGHPVGMAQRMEAAAPPGGVMCAESTAQLVERSAILGPPEWVAVKGTREPVAARRLEGFESEHAVLGRDDGPFLGRDADVAALLGAYDSATVSVACVVGEAGLGKSRLLRELIARATSSGADVVLTQCESHTANVPFHVLSRVLRALFGIGQLDPAAVRLHILHQLSNVAGISPDDAEILFDILSVGSPDAGTPAMSADARRRRLVEVMRKVAAGRRTRTLYVVEDVHWIDAASEGVLAEFAATLPRTRSLFASSFRPEYHGPILEVAEMSITLAPLNDAATLDLATELVGKVNAEPAVVERIALLSKGNPFFVEEIVRDLVGRKVLAGNRGNYQVVGDLDAVVVPATVQAVLAARIDRLGVTEKSILNAGAIIGSSFDEDILEVLVPGADSSHLRNLISAELIDQIQFLPEPRYAFRHPLVRAVSYESQLSATRADGHARLAAAIEERNPASLEENSALIAQHLDAAGRSEAAHAWYMRAGAWLSNRDTNGARRSWERAREIADGLPHNHDGVIGMRIAPRAQLTFRPWLVGEAADDERLFNDLQALTTQSGDVLSLAMGMAGRVTSLVLTHGQPRIAAIMANELCALIDTIDPAAPEMAELLLAVAFARYETGDVRNALQVMERLRAMVPAPAGTDLAPATCLAGAIKVLIGRRADGHRDLEAGLRLARNSDAVCNAIALGYRIDPVVLGYDIVDEALVSQTRDGLVRAEAFGDRYGLALARSAYGIAVLRSGDPRRSHGVDLLHQSRVDGIDVYGGSIDAVLAAELVHNGMAEPPIDDLLAAVQWEIDTGAILFVGFPLAVLVHLLVVRGGVKNVALARRLFSDFQASLPDTVEPAIRLWLLRCQTVLSDGETYPENLTRYRELAEDLDARGHLAAVERLAAGPPSNTKDMVLW
ncbi:MAG: AAA family ATPase [Mycobacterium sp.]|nr:AAA family ATPase [Mycobacterium sp.]